MESINLGKADAVDLSIELSGPREVKLVSTIAYGYSEVDVKYRLKYFLQMFLNHYPATEFTGSVEVKAPESSALNPDVKQKIKSYAEFDIKSQISDRFIDILKIHGTFGRSPARQKYLLEQPEAQECIAEDENIFVACDKINVLADVYDQLNLSVMLEQSKLFKYNILAISQNMDKILPEENVETNEVTPLNKDADKVDFSVRFTPENALDINIYNPNKDIKLINIGSSDLAASAFSFDDRSVLAKEFLKKDTGSNALDASALEDKSRKLIDMTWYSVTSLTFPLFLYSCLYHRQITGENVR